MPKKKILRDDQSNLNAYRAVSARVVHLDGKNPRHNPLERDAEMIAELCDDQLVALATDIAKRGALSPLELIGVIEYEGLPGHYIAVEGNRRTCALLLLSDPKRAPSAKYVKQFERLASEAQLPDTLHLHVFDNRESAHPWIGMRHLGDQGGVGTREWSNPAKARFAQQSEGKTTAKGDILALKIMDRLQALELITQEQRNEIPLTTITRYLNNKTRRAMFGLAGLDDDSNLIFTHDPSEVDQALLRFVLDCLKPEDGGSARVHSRTSAAEQTSYVQDLVSKGQTPVTRLDKPMVAPAPKPSSKAETSVPGVQRTRSSTNPTARSKLISSSFTVQSRDKVLLRLRAEMLSLNVEGHEFAANYLLRAFVERILVLYYQHKHPRESTPNEQGLCRECAAIARAEGAPRPIQNVLNQAESSKHHAHSLHTLGTAVHGSSVPEKRQLLTVFDHWEPALKYMLSSLQLPSTKA